MIMIALTVASIRQGMRCQTNYIKIQNSHYLISMTKQNSNEPESVSAENRMMSKPIEVLFNRETY